MTAPLPEMAFTDPVLPRDPAELPDELPRGASIPEDLDPLAAGVLMAHQSDWLADESELKLAEKGRRTGITFAEALDATLIAMAKPSEGGENYFYIGDTKDKGREFIGYVAHFARTVAKELVAINETVFNDQKPDGTTRDIPAFRCVFASGKRVEALASRPSNIRALQGTVCIDEAAFHPDVRMTIDSANALLIWGSKIRVISTHFGVLNPFNELIREAQAGKVPYSLHFIPFSKAVENGLYERVCLVKNRIPTAEGKAAWEKKIRSSYGVREAAMKQELDCIPAEGEGAALTRVQIESCMRPNIPVVRWALPDSFRDSPKHIRKAETRRFCREKLQPHLDKLRADRPHYFGEDFARSGDTTAVLIAELNQTLDRETRLLLEMRNVPFETQRDVMFYIVERLPRFSGGAADATGNGAYLAEAMRQKFGERIYEVKFSTEWYRVNAVPYVEAFSDGTIVLPMDLDVVRDHQALVYEGGVIKVPADMRYKGEADGLERHGDVGIAGMLLWFASLQGVVDYGYQPVGAGGRPQVRPDGEPLHPDDFTRRDPFATPLGASIRGSV